MRDVGWRPGLLGQLRAFVRRALLVILGTRGEQLLHRTYHRVLRTTGRFGPPEDAITVSLLSAIAARSRTIIDVGANVGRYTWFLRQHAPPGSTVFAIEPHPGAASLLRAAIGNVPGCVVLEVAAAAKDAGGELVVPVGAFGSPISGLAWVHDGDDSDADGEIRVHLRRLDSLIKDGAIRVDGPVFMKIDVEGGEAGVLRGAAALLGQHRPILYFECQAGSLARQGETPEGVWGELEAAGYRIFGNRGRGFAPMQGIEPEMVNYLAIPDLAASDNIEFLIGAAADPILDAWAARTRRRADVSE